MVLCVDNNLDVEHIRCLKQTRTNAKRELTKAVNHIEAVLLVGQTMDDVNAADDKLEEAFQDFKLACESYKAVLVNEADIEECFGYMHEVETKFHDTRRRVFEFFQSVEDHSSVREDDIRPKDSVSEVKSRTSNSLVSSRSSKNSKRSGKSAIQDKMLKNAATKAPLLTEASMLDECHDIAQEELRLSQRKQRLTLDTKLIKLEAEERVCTEFAMASGSQGRMFKEPLRKPLTKTAFQQKTTHFRMHHRRDKPPQSFVSSRRISNNQSAFCPQAQRKSAAITRGPLIQSSSEGVDFPRPHCSLNPYASHWNPAQENPRSEIRINTTVNGEEYIDTVKKLTIAALLPKSELCMFDGNPLKYFLFIRSFENNVEKDTCDFSRRLQLLIQFCTGKARRAIEGCILLQPQEGYMKAKNILAERFGDAYAVSNSWLKKISCGPVIKPGDRGGLQELADDLENCEMTLTAAGRMTQLNNEDRLVKF